MWWLLITSVQCIYDCCHILCLQKPIIVLLDEPSTGYDPHSKDSFGKC